jgi:hypothetical protein
MRPALVLLGLLALGACAAQPSSSERALLSASEPRSVLIEQDAQAILHGMDHARTSSQRMARWAQPER